MTAKPKATKDLLQSPKGMRDIMNEEYYEMQGFFEKAQEIAMYYGFSPIETPSLEHEEIFMKSVGDGTDIVDKEMYSLKTKSGDRLAMRPEGTAAVMRAYIEHGMRSLPQPVMFYYQSAMFRHDKPQKGRYRQHHQFGLEMIGTEKPIADALIIKTTLSILEAAGAKDLFININSIGDAESRKEYQKALRNYYKKFTNELGATDRARLVTNPLRILDSKDPKTMAINEDAPDSVSFLSNDAKKHFKQVLEYLDECQIPYQITKSLVRGMDYYTHTVFEIMEKVTDEDGTERDIAICGGGRYDYLAKAIGYKKDIPGVGVGIGVERVMGSSWWKKLTPRIIKTPKIYFIQLGFDARLKSLNVLEMLRKAKIPMYQAIAKDNLGSQLAQAEKMGTPYVMIFGQKESIDNTVIIRNMENRSQKIVKIDQLVEYLKTLK
jgi:histidyl-tRNA synthetase